MDDIPGARVRVLRVFSTDHSPRSWRSIHISTRLLVFSARRP